MNNRSIGVFDSGLGGLTAVKSISELMPNEDIVYFGDTARIPYGTKTEATIKQYAAGDIRFLESEEVKLIVIACGTASSVALEDMKKMFKTPIVGVVEAASKAAAARSRNGKIGVIGTGATVKSGSYKRAIKEQNERFAVYQNACPLFVPLVENGHFNTEVTRLVVKEYLEPIKNEGVDTLILGCTHYPLLQEAIGDYMGSGVELISPGAELAAMLPDILGKENLADESRKGCASYFVSDDVEGFSRLGSVFLQKEIIGMVKKIDIEKY